MIVFLDKHYALNILFRFGYAPYMPVIWQKQGTSMECKRRCQHVALLICLEKIRQNLEVLWMSYQPLRGLFTNR